MKLYEYIYDYPDIIFSYICDNPNEILYFDIETTGLSPKYSDLYMIGYGFQFQEKFKIVLLFNDDGCSEPEMLAHFKNILTSYKYLVSYNGDTFDIPYMLEKFRQFELESDLNNLSSVDIYRILKPYKKLLHLESMKQFDLEERIGFHRSEFISGGDLIQEYKDYKQSRSELLLNHLLRHNLDDIDGLIKITNVLAVHQICSGAFHILSLELESDYAIFHLNVPNLPFRITYGYQNLFLNGIDTELTLRIPIRNCKMKYYFPDYRNYYYLPVEDTAIHKSMAEYVDKEYKEKATKATAYVYKEGIYLPQSKPSIGKCYKRDIAEKESFLLLDQKFLDNIEMQQEYVANLLKNICKK